MKKALSIPFWLFVVLWFAALVLPFGAFALLPVFLSELRSQFFG